MRKIFHLMALGAAALAVLCCGPVNVEPVHEAGEYSHSLAVINEDYYESLVLTEITSVAPVTVTSADNFPYWLSVKAADELNKDGHPVLQVTVKKDADVQEDRQIEAGVTLSTGDVIKLTVKQGSDLPTGANADVLYSMNTEFETDWASCKSISLVTTYRDVNGKTEVTTTEVALPWATGALTEEWLPEGAAEEMVKRKDQWELVFNLTGIASRPHYNYFGMYNKYTGKLRIFYYMDDDHMPPSGANDHMWSLLFSDALAEYPVFQYGVPYNVSVNNAYKQVLGAPNMQYMTSATTSQISRSYKVTPRVGWWAYDVDLSQLRPSPMLSKGGYITPGLLLFNQDNIFLNSIVKGNIEGSINGSVNLKALLPTGLNTTAMVFQDIIGFLNTGVGSWGVGSMAAGAVNGGLFYGLSTGQAAANACFSLALNIIDQAGQEDPTDEDNLGKIEMDAKLNLTGEIVTQGTIGGERSTIVSSPKIPREYIKAGTHFGEGVWNIENHPVVYVLGDAFWSDVKNFLSYEKGEEKDASGKVIRTYYKVVKDPKSINLRLVSFLDPTSIGNVRLNTNVYDASASVQLTQTCGIYPGSEVGYTKGFREGLGVSAQTTPISNGAFNTAQNKDFVMVQRPVDDPLFEFDIPQEAASIMAFRLSQQQDESNADLVRQYFGQSLYYFKVNPAVTEVDRVQFVADPQVILPFVKKNDSEYLLYDPDYVDWVVSVALRIEQGTTVIALSRLFVPEVRVISYKDMPALIDQMRARKGQFPANVAYPGTDEAIDRIQQYYNAIITK